MHTLEDLGEYQRKFLKIARMLINNRKLSKLDQDTLFLTGLPVDIETQVCQRLLITKTAHHPSDPYPIDDIVDATKFLLTGSALRPLAAAPVTTPYTAPPFQLPPRKTGRPDPRAASVAEEVDLLAIEALRSKSVVPPRVPGSSLPRFPTPSSSSTDTIPTRAEPFIPSSSVTPSGQFRCSFPLEDKTAPKRLLDRVLATTVPVPVRELIAVAPDVCKQLKDLAIAKRIPISTNTVQVNELAGRDPGAVDHAFGSRVHCSNDGLIVAHHSIPLQSLKVKIIGTGHTILGVLHSGSEIVAMPK